VNESRRLARDLRKQLVDAEEARRVDQALLIERSLIQDVAMRFASQGAAVYRENDVAVVQPPPPAPPAADCSSRMTADRD